MARFIFLISAFIIFHQNIFSQIGSKVNTQKDISGTWVNNDFGFEMILVLNADGTGEFDGESLKFSVEGNQLHVSQYGSLLKYSYSLQPNQLILTGGDLEQAITFSKISAADTPQFYDNSGGELTITHTDKIEGQTSTSDLLGIWSTDTESIEFKSNGLCAYQGQSFPYKAHGGKLTLITIEGEVTFGYTVTGDKLYITHNQNTVTYTRGTKGTTSEKQAVQNTGEGNVDPPLVGKWCYVDVSNVYGSSSSSSSTCITLNGDGTFLYYSESSRSVNTPDLYGGTNAQSTDQGTWYVKGDRIYYNSRSTGQGSYKLEKRNHPKNVNDPMIVLDGTAYVTAYRKDPWR